MDAVLPLTVRDVSRARLLFDSLAPRFRGLGTLWIVSPDTDSALIESSLREYKGRLDLQVVPETRIAPELAHAPWLKGWYRQQLVKLAIHEHIASPFYLTLDADVICVRELTPEDLTPGGRAICHVVEQDLHGDWYAASEAVLGLSPRRRGISHNVTPAVLSREAVAELATYLSGRAQARHFASGFRGLKQRLWSLGSSSRSYRGLLAASAPWTEYALYYTFLEATQRFDRYHSYSEHCIYDIDRSVWRSERQRFAALSPDECFEGAGPPWFLVVQSNTELSPELVRQKLGAQLSHVG